MDKYKGKYRIQSHRKPNWDYSANALYFLTIVTQNRECNLGKIIKTDDSALLELSDFGKIVEHEWFKSFEIRNELILHAFTIMPNHLHTIIEICNNNHDGMNMDGMNRNGTTDYGTAVETHGRVSLPIRAIHPIENPNDILKLKRNPPIRLPKSISSFIAGFKSAVNTKIDDYIDEHKLSIPKYNRNNHLFQSNYHDHIIRDEYEYLRISNYIDNNPMNWAKDKMNGLK